MDINRTSLCESAKDKESDAEKNEITYKKIYPQLRIRLCDEEPLFGPGTICLLRLIRTCASMKEACMSMEMSYSKGWKIINRAEEGLGYKLIHRRHGGKQGGRCTLTEEAVSLIERYEVMEQRVKSYMQEQFSQLFPECVTP